MDFLPGKRAVAAAESADIQANVVSPSLMRRGASRLLQLVDGPIARDWLRQLLERANADCEAR